VKGVMGWLLVFVCALVFTFFVDLGGNFFGLPDIAVQVLFAANLTLFLWLLGRFAGRPIGGALDDRRAAIAEGLELAKQRVDEAESLRQEVQQRLDQVEHEVTELKERADREGRVEAEEIERQAAHEEERFLKRVDDEITRREAEARENLARETATLTARLTKELLQQELTDEDRRRILDRNLSALRTVSEEE
jgi:F-type H+-transporting ATPase subunit b